MSRPQQEAERVFENVFDPTQQLRRQSSVDHAMIGGDREGREPPYGELSFAHDRGLPGAADADNGGLWRVDDGVKSVHFVHAEVRERGARASGGDGCYLMTGDADYMLRVVVPDIAAFERFLFDHLTRVPGVANLRSSFALKQVKYTTALPIYDSTR